LALGRPISGGFFADFEHFGPDSALQKHYVKLFKHALRKKELNKNEKLISYIKQKVFYCFTHVGYFFFHIHNYSIPSSFPET